MRGGGGCLQVRHALRDLGEGRGEQAHIQDERDDHADIDDALDREDRAEHAHGDIGQVADDIHERLHDAGQELRTPVRVVNSVVQRVKGLADRLCRAGNAHDLVAGIHFLDIAVQFAEAFLPGGKVFLRTGHNEHNEQKAHERNAQRGKRQPPLGHEHHDEAAGKLRRGGDDCRQAVGQSLLERGDIVGDAAENIALCMKVEVFLRHPVDLFGQLRAHTVGHFERDARHDIVLDEAKERAQAVNDGKQYADSCNGCKINAAEQAVGHDGRDLTDLIRADDGQHGAERRQHERQNDDAEAPAHIRAQVVQSAFGIRFFCWTHIGPHLDAPPFLSSSSLSCDMAISR